MGALRLNVATVIVKICLTMGLASFARIIWDQRTYQAKGSDLVQQGRKSFQKV